MVKSVRVHLGNFGYIGNLKGLNQWEHEILINSEHFLPSGRIVEDILCPVAHELIRDESSYRSVNVCNQLERCLSVLTYTSE